MSPGHVLVVLVMVWVACCSLGHGISVARSRNPFLPAPPGFRPACALPGLTFCDQSSLQGTAYPIDTIEMLIDGSGSSGGTNPLLSFFGDEREGDFEPSFVSTKPRVPTVRSQPSKFASTLLASKTTRRAPLARTRRRLDQVMILPSDGSSKALEVGNNILGTLVIQSAANQVTSAV